MSFKNWFKKWRIALFRLLTVNTKKRKTDAQRKKERRRRIKNKFSGSGIYNTKKRRARCRSSYGAQNRRIIEAMLGFAIASIGILFVPFKLFGKENKRGVKGASNKRSVKGASNKRGVNVKTASNIYIDKKAESDTSSKASQEEALKTERKFSGDGSKENLALTFSGSAIPQELDENTPKSKPKHSNDKYIRKRMIIDNSLCGDDACKNLEIGSRFDLVAEENSALGKDAVKLVFEGQKIGYLEKKDSLAISTCLRLRRKIYGVVTDITYKDAKIQYEFEAWFDYEK